MNLWNTFKLTNRFHNRMKKWLNWRSSWITSKRCWPTKSMKSATCKTNLSRWNSKRMLAKNWLNIIKTNWISKNRSIRISLKSRWRNWKNNRFRRRKSKIEESKIWKSKIKKCLMKNKKYSSRMRILRNWGWRMLICLKIIITWALGSDKPSNKIWNWRPQMKTWSCR